MPFHVQPQPIDPSRYSTILIDLAPLTTLEIAGLIENVIDAQLLVLDTVPDDAAHLYDWQAYDIATEWRKMLRLVFEEKFFAVT